MSNLRVNTIRKDFISTIINPFTVFMIGCLLCSNLCSYGVEKGSKYIQFDSGKGNILLSTDQMSYAINLFKYRKGSSFAEGIGLPLSLYWGAKIDRIADLPNAHELTYHAWGHSSNARQSHWEYPLFVWTAKQSSFEPAIKLREPDTAEYFNAGFEKYELISDTHLALSLLAGKGTYRIILHYELYPEYDLIARWAEVVNLSSKKITLENFFSAQWALARGRDWRLTHLDGAWGQEYQVTREKMTMGTRCFESRSGLSGHHHVPFFAFDEGNADERSGEIWFGTLLWSGNWKFQIEQTAYGETNILGGLNNFDFELDIEPGKSVRSPVFLAGYTDGGFGKMSRTIHRYQQEKIFPENMRKRVMPVVYNTYSSIRRETVTEENVLKLIPAAAKIGVEAFIIDAGWQKNMGDWVIDPVKFPGGFKKIIDEVKRNGMEFGIWLEFERADKESEVYQKHPEWLIDQEGYSLLNLARDDVREYIYGVIKKFLSENEIAYFKIDLNRQPGVSAIENRRPFLTKYTENFYEIFRRLRADFPNVYFENCAGGSGRLDLEMDRYFSRINRSDNQDTLDILNIHEGFTYLHPSKMGGGGCQISHLYTYLLNHRDFPMQFMAYAGMMSWLSIGLPLDTTPQEELDECAEYIKLYKRFRHIVDFGELYRVATYRETGKYAAFEFVSQDRSEALLFVFGHGMKYGSMIPNIRLDGLDPDAVYTVERFGDPRIKYKGFGLENFKLLPVRPMSGKALENYGLPVWLCGDLDSRLFYFKNTNSK
ncbi:MAG: alpha-galactosidase [Planctomycetia bacterium]|nr:alpha-galactosidase [Planctomycetia bacterium]